MLKPLPFQNEGIQFLLDNRSALLADDMGCISGDAAVKICRAGNTRTYTLRHAYESWSSGSWDRRLPTYVRGLKAGHRFGRIEVADILYQGIKETVELSLTSGKTICATPDHRVLTPQGWRPAGTLSAGDEVLTNGTPVCSICGSNHDVITYHRAKFRGQCKECMYKHLRKNGRAYLGVDNISNISDFRHRYGADVVMVPKIDTVASVRHTGLKPVYDIKCVKHHNFVANGIVVHNCGKTVQAIEACKQLKAERVLVVCPLAVRRNWCRVFHQQAPHYTVREMTTARQIPLLQDHVCVVNYDIAWRRPLFEYLRQGKWDVIICDEAHKLKTPTSNRTKAILGGKGLVSRASFRWMLTGTPVLNRPVEIWPMIRSLRPDLLGEYRSFYAFTKRFCGGREGQWGWECSGATHLEELAAMIKPFLLRRRKCDVLKELPSVMYQKIYLNTDKRLDDLSRQEKAQYHGGNRNELLGEASTLRREIGLLKLQSAIGYIEDLLEERDKVVVFGHHKDVLGGIAAHFGSAAVLCTGAQSGAQKQVAVDAFVQKPCIKLFLGNIVAAGQGIDGLQTVCDTAVFVELSYVPGEVQQAISRLERMGQRDVVTAQFLLVEGSVDEDIVDTLYRKTKIVGKVMDENVKFAASKCSICKRDVDLGGIRRVLGTDVCENCAVNMEVLL